MHVPGTLQRARHFLAGRSVSSTHGALIKAPAGADDAIASRLDTLALNTDGGGVWAAGRAVSHLWAAERRKCNLRAVASKTVM